MRGSKFLSSIVSILVGVLTIGLIQGISKSRWSDD